MESPPAGGGAPAEEFHFEESGHHHLEGTTEAEPTGAAVTATVTMGESFATDTRVIVTSSGEQFSLSSAKAIELLGEEFVAKLKAEPVNGREQHHQRQQQQEPLGRTRVVMAVTAVESNTTQTTMTTTTHEAAGGNLVYCNLNDLDLAESGSGTESYSFASLHSLADASSAAQQQAGRIVFFSLTLLTCYKTRIALLF